MMRKLVSGGGLLLNEDMSPLRGVLARMRREGSRSRGRTTRTNSHADHAYPGTREARLVLGRRRPHLLLGPQHMLLLLLQHLRLLLARYPRCHHSC